MLENGKKHILIVEDDLEICRLLDMFLRTKGYQVSLSNSGTEGLADIARLQPDLVVLDIMMPGMNGIEVCKQSREIYTGPIIMLTACSEEISEIAALDTGADGYLHKPLRPHILLSHIEALLRRESRSKKSDNALSHTGTLTIDTLKRLVTRDNEEIILTGAEYEMLEYLAKQAGTIISRDECYKALKGVEFDGLDRALDMRLSSLRKKIKDDVAPYQIIKTIRCKGYLFVKQ
ncbi:response regulator transcription factor [Moritella viscosa]|uniref:response regulator transcription factor n=1 Tax=Moritella viscosa TaxID=80854 RepID=UPI000911FF9C|nr:response regulator transcription factor [Moritella viscosa]SGY87758.1 DNA-binding response regulator [Moritella viscosa]SGY87778.1 DNA-binding response regulator [Moritella viscosa]SHO00755.1 DNA-binding response regulator [Moritella viscosa]SHO01067.1 DNA-binding response regulator [Moritella viscosa]SHO02516.1 DNA-binding response regulator [Moritella viscosa]